MRIVELARLDDGEDVPAAVVAELGLASEQASSPEALQRAGNLDVLVVLDNAEHVIGETARAVDLLLRGGPAVRVLTTSRERLGVDGEHVWTVAPLGAAGTEAPGCRLFVERARAAVSGLDLAADDELVARIVRRLDGLPLAIEMAAAQLATTSLAELADVLDERVDALRSPRRDVAERHRSLAAVLAWSEERLAEDEATILAELSVFAGPVAAADIAGVLGRDDAADIARSLAARSLVSVDRSTSPARFQLLFTVRDFAGRKLAETGREPGAGRPPCRLVPGRGRRGRPAAAHARRACRPPPHRGDLRRAPGRPPLGPRPRPAPRRRPLRAPPAVRLHPPRRRAPPVGRGAGQGPGGPLRRRCRHCCTAVATRALTRGDLPLATSLAGRAAELAGRTPARLSALDVLCDGAMYDGRLEDSIAASDELGVLAEELGDAYYAVVGRCGAVMAAAYMGQPAGEGGRRSPRSTRWRDVTTSHRRHGAGWPTPVARSLAATDPERGLRGLRRSPRPGRGGRQPAARRRGPRVVVLAPGEGGGRRPGRCRRSPRRSGTGRQLADRTHQLTTLRNLAVLLERADEPDAAAELLGAVDRTDVPTYGEEAARLEAVRAWTHERLGADRARRLADLGSARDVSAAARWALEVVSVGRTPFGGRGRRARPSPGVGAGVGAEP